MVQRNVQKRNEIANSNVKGQKAKEKWNYRDNSTFHELNGSATEFDVLENQQGVVCGRF